MKNFLTVFCVLSTYSLSSYSLELACQSKYFMGQPAKLELTANSEGENSITDVKLILEGQEIRNVKVAEAVDYNGSKYKDMINYKLPPIKTNKIHIQYPSLSLLLPQGWGEQGRFVGYIIQQASDGGSYNKVFCSSND